MTQKQQALVSGFLGGLSGAERPFYARTAEFLSQLGYIPQKQRVSNDTLSFRHSGHGRVIAKMSYDAKRQRASLRIKFFACRDVPQRYLQLLRAEYEEGGYTRSIPPPDLSMLAPGAIMVGCTSECGACTGGRMRYFVRFADGMQVFRCSAYPVPVTGLDEEDLGEMQRLLLEQDAFFAAQSAHPQSGAL